MHSGATTLEPADQADGGTMNQCDQATAIVDAELRGAVATAQLVRFEIFEADDYLLRDDGVLHLDLCLTPRPQIASACYPNRWGSHRYEPIGELFLLPPGEVMRARSGRAKQTSLVCRINPELIGKWFDGDLEWTASRLEAVLDIRDQSIRCHLMRLAREVTHPGFASDMLLELIVAQLAIELGRYCASVKPLSGKKGLASWQLKLIDERVNELGKSPSLTELAKLCKLSIRQLSRCFQISRGCSIGQYVERSRIESAKRLLVSGQSAKTVAYSMGFASPSSFSCAFRRTTGMSPAHFRQFA